MKRTSKPTAPAPEVSKEPSPSPRRRSFKSSDWVWLLAAITLIICAGSIVGLFLLAEQGVSAGSVVQPLTIFAPATPTPQFDPAIQLTPDQGDPGTNLTVTGTGWPPGDIVAVSLQQAPDSPAVVLADTSTTVNNTGTFSLTFSLPELDIEWTSRPVILINVQSQTSSAVAAAEFTMVAATPTPSNTPTTLPTFTATALPTATPTPTPTTTPLTLPTPPPPATLNSWYGEYWANPTTSGVPDHVENVREINFDWGFGAPAANLPVDNFSARWTRDIIFRQGYYRFQIEANGGARFWLDDELLIDKQQSSLTFEVSNYAVTNGLHRLRVEFYEYTGPANISFYWRRVAPIVIPPPTFTPLPTITPVPTVTPIPTLTPTSTPTLTPIPTATFTPTFTPTPNPQAVALQAATQHLIGLTGLPASEIELLSLEAVEWPNSQLGCPTEDVAGLPVITPGYRIMLQARSQWYEYHTDREGRVVLCGQGDANGDAGPIEESNLPTEINP